MKLFPTAGSRCRKWGTHLLSLLSPTELGAGEVPEPLLPCSRLGLWEVATWGVVFRKNNNSSEKSQFSFTCFLPAPLTAWRLQLHGVAVQYVVFIQGWQQQLAGRFPSSYVCSLLTSCLRCPCIPGGSNHLSPHLPPHGQDAVWVASAALLPFKILDLPMVTHICGYLCSSLMARYCYLRSGNIGSPKNHHSIGVSSCTFPVLPW